MEQIFNRFPEKQAEIKQLLEENPNFQEMCTDYEEVKALIATLTSSSENHPETIQGYQTLLKNLEAEILAALQAYDRLPVDRAKHSPG